jgi:hypothetical protein
MFFSWINRVRTILPKNFQRASRQHAAMANSWNYIQAWHTEYRSTKTVVYEPLAKMRKIGVDYTMAAAERRSPARLLFGEPDCHVNSPPSNERLAWFENSDRYG